MTKKICSKCKQEKDVFAFSKCKWHKSGFHNLCKRCSNDNRNLRRHNNPEMVKDECLRKAFGISFADYKAMLLQQRGVCAICKKPETATFKGRLTHLSVDHNHLTGQVRGLLCRDCNSALGFLQDDIDKLQCATNYLTFWSKVQER